MGVLGVSGLGLLAYDFSCNVLEGSLIIAKTTP